MLNQNAPDIPNLYEVLGLTRAASYAAIKKRFRKLSLEKHPDHGGNPEEFKLLHLAYHTLYDSERRKIYNETGTVNRTSLLNENAMMLQGLAQVFEKLLHSGEAFKTKDIPERLLVKLVEDIVKLQEEVDNFVALQKSCKTLRKRIKRKDDKPNMFSNVLDENIKKLQGQIDKGSLMIKISNLIIEELSNYSSFEDTVRSFVTINTWIQPGPSIFANTTRTT